jgi:anaerobic dimethyl sulfoxide reductase subunit B (iron-sulfur subunit)
MTKQLGFFIDVSKCTGCKTCQVACKDKNSLPVGMNFRRVTEASGGAWRQNKMDGTWKQDVYAYYLSVACNQCSDPACVKACPTGAHFKRAEDGLVLIDQSKCIGCGACYKACPYGAPQYDKNARKMYKCNGCEDRLAKGMLPVCVEACPQRAIEFGDIDELMRRHPGCEKHIAPLPDPAQTRPNLLVKAPRDARPVGDKSVRVYFPLKQ